MAEGTENDYRGAPRLFFENFQYRVDGMTKIFKQGLAIGQSDIREDCWHFRFYDEYFLVLKRKLKTRMEGQYLVADIEEVRKVADG